MKKIYIIPNIEIASIDAEDCYLAATSLDGDVPADGLGTEVPGYGGENTGGVHQPGAKEYILWEE